MTRIGDLKDLVTLQRAVSTPDGAGGVSKTWPDFGREWMQAKTIQGSITYRGDGLKESEATIFVTRSPTNARQGDRLVWRGVSHDIEAVTPIEGQPRWLGVRCRVRQGGEP